ncbi:NUDIX domain-containing protein [Streptomyces sp. NPDC088258]|uniref:NUDIX domain-containing protein n=1 Tax=Streptomyces sp. NPDC088258 TaxID=3365849 RepID=UPI003806F872
MEAGESPMEAARREVREELGIEADVHATDLFSVESVQATAPGRRDRLAFVFAGLRLPATETDLVTPEPEPDAPTPRVVGVHEGDVTPEANRDDIHSNELSLTLR